MERVVSLQGPSGDQLYTLVCGLNDPSEKGKSSAGDSHQRERPRWVRQMTREAKGSSGSGDCDHWALEYLERPSLCAPPWRLRPCGSMGAVEWPSLHVTIQF